MKILIINGPNLNMLGNREVDIYGELSLDQIQDTVSKRASELNVELSMFQSNYEGEIVDIIHGTMNNTSGLIVNLAGYTHTSVVIRDALLLLNIPIIEVHLSNIYAREFFRRKSIIADVVSGHISGLGANGYVLALEAIVELCR